MARIANAYAYYLSTYGNNRPSRYDSHKRSDLRRIYNHMVKTNKEAPLYKLTNVDEAARYAIDIKENAKVIQNVVASLSDSYGGFEDSFRKKVAVSSDESAVDVKYVGDGNEDNIHDTFSVEVKQLSSPQVNVGNYLKNDALSFIPGAYSFDLNTNSSLYEFQFNVNQGETNLDILKKLANLVNRSTLSINAAIRNGNTHTGGEGTSALALTSIQTGLDEGESFLFDIAPGTSADSIKAMDLLGINQITHPSENSLFYLNGEEHSSLSNTFTINNTFELTLKSATTDKAPAQISFKTSTDAVADNIMSLVNAFNGILGIASNSSANAAGESNKLLAEISGLSRIRKESLAEIGLMVAEDGSITLDKEVLAEAITPERSEDTFQSLSRFKSAIGAKADNVAINPMNYVNKKVVAYKNPGKTWAAPYFASVYSGMLLDIRL